MKKISIALITIIGFSALLVGCDNGETNETTLETVATPTATPPAGTYSTTQTVTLSTATAEARIYYTLDASTPTTNSSRYVSPIPIGVTTTLRAIAVKEGMNASAELTAMYTIIPTMPPETAATRWCPKSSEREGFYQSNDD